MNKLISVSLPRQWQGTLKLILEEKAREYTKAERDIPDGPTEAWAENARQCLNLAAQLKRV